MPMPHALMRARVARRRVGVARESSPRGARIAETATTMKHECLVAAEP
jgi:hypothetical protein